MNKGKRTAISCILMLYILSGCRLAREDMGAGNYDDRFVGFYITYQYIDLFDINSYLNDNIANGSFGLITEGNTDKYKGRIYAELVTGESYGLSKYIFPDVEGVSYFSAVVVPESDGNDSYTTSISDPAIIDGNMNVIISDNENSKVLTGTLYVSPKSNIGALYFNPVYQSKDGSVYLTAGSGISVQGVQSEGSVMSTSMDSETTVTENGKAKTEKMSVTVSVKTMFPPSKIAVLQMDKNNSLITRTEFINNALPNSIDIDSKTVYIIVEEYKEYADNMEEIARKIYGNEDASIEVFSAADNGVCTKHWIEMKW